MNQVPRIISKKNIDLLDKAGNHICDIYEYTIRNTKGFISFVYNPQENSYADTEDAYTEVGTEHPRGEEDNIFIYVKRNKPENFKYSLRQYMNSKGSYTEEEILECEKCWENRNSRFILIAEYNGYNNGVSTDRMIQFTGDSEIKVRNIDN